MKKCNFICVKKKILLLLIVFSGFLFAQTESSQNLAKFDLIQFDNQTDPTSIVDSIRSHQKRKESLLKQNKIVGNEILDSLVIVYSDSFRVIHVYENDENGHKVKDTEYHIENGMKKYYERISYSYDSDYNLLTEIYEFYKYGVWTYTYKYDWTYFNNLWTSESHFIWEDGWVLRYRDYYNYDSNELLLSIEEIYGNVRNVAEYNYDNIGRLVESIYSGWKNDSLATKQRSAYEYEINGFSQIRTYNNWINNDWVNVDRTSKIINDEHIVEEKIEIWENNNWLNQTKEENKYNESGKIIESIINWWDEFTNTWDKYRRYSYEYNANSDQVLSLFEIWKSSYRYGPSSWYGQSRTTTTFSLNGLEIRETTEGRTDIGDWEIKYMYEKKYNEHDNLIHQLHNSYESDWFYEYSVMYDSKQNRTYMEELMIRSDTIDYHNKTYFEYDSYDRVISRKFYMLKIDYYSLNKTNKTYYYYNNGEQIFREDFLTENFTISQNYPNPFNPSTTINFTNSNESNIKITLYNILGQKIKTIVNEYFLEGFHNVNVDLSNWSSGIYFYRLEACGLIKTKKMIKIK